MGLISLQASKALVVFGYREKCPYEYCLIDNTVHPFVDNELRRIEGKQPYPTIPAPNIFEAVEWLWKNRGVELSYDFENNYCLAFISGTLIGRASCPSAALELALEYYISHLI